MANQPQMVYRAMRESMAAVEVVDSPAGKTGLICHRKHVEQALRRPETFATTEAIDLGNVRPLIPLGIGLPEHRGYRRVLDPLFVPPGDGTARGTHCRPGQPAHGSH